MNPNDAGPNCPLCSPVDPAAALRAIREMPAAEELVEESHFSLSIRRCPRCGAALLSIFTELIDWQDGDDSQAWLCVQLTEDELRRLREAGADERERELGEMSLSRRHLAWVHPRGSGSSGSESVSWYEGPVVVLPHD